MSFLKVSNEKHVEIGQVIEKLFGGASIKTEEYVDSGVLVISKKAANPSGRTILEKDDYKYCTEEFATENYRSIIGASHLITSLRSLDATNPQIGYIVKPPDGDRFILAQGAYGISIKRDLVLPRYLVIASSSKMFRNQLTRKIVGGTQVHMRSGDFLACTIPLPDLAIQKRFVDFFDAVDREIHLTQNRFESLERRKRGFLNAAFDEAQV